MKYKEVNLPRILFFSTVICFIYLLYVSWMKWGNIVIDTPREMWMPLQVLKGRVLYKDLAYEYGFLPPYLLSFVYRIFGVSVISLVGVGITVTVLMTALLYKISRFFLNEIFSFLVIVTFMFVFAFGHYSGGIFNFILPYSFASTFFMLFTASSLYFFLEFIVSEKRKHLLLWGVSLILSFLCRPDMSIPVWAGFVFIGEIFIFKTRKKIWRFNLYFIAPLLISILCYILFIIKMQALEGFKGSIIELVTFGITKNDAFVSNMIGLNNIGFNISLIVKSFVLHLIVILLIGAGSIAVSSFFLNKKEESNITLPLIGLVVITAAFMLGYNLLAINFLQYRCMVLLLIIGAGVFFVKTFTGPDFKKNISCLLLFVISILTITRIIFKTLPYGYGFYMLDLSLICYYVFFFRIIKNVVRKLRINNFPMNFFLSVLACLFLFLISPYWRISSYVYAHKNVKINTNMGSIFCFPVQGTLRYWEAVEYIRNNVPDDAAVVVVPEGVGINLFTSRKNPSRYYSFVPPVCIRIGEGNIIAELNRYNIDYFVIVHRTTAEYGYPFFGVDYGKKIFSWINEHYEVIKQFGPMPFTSKEFGVAVLKRKVIQN